MPASCSAIAAHGLDKIKINTRLHEIYEKMLKESQNTQNVDSEEFDQTLDSLGGEMRENTQLLKQIAANTARR